MRAPRWGAPLPIVHALRLPDPTQKTKSEGGGGGGKFV